MKKYNVPSNLIKRTTKVYKVVKIVVLVTFAIFILGSVTYTGSKIYGYFEDRIFSFQSPIILRNPLIIKLREAQAQKVESIVKPKQVPLKPKKTSYLPIVVKTEKDIVLAQKHGEVLWNIYMLESTRGKNDYCRANGLGFAGFGVMNEGKIICYESFEKAAQRASYWYGKLSEGNDLATSLCIWNQGIATNDCNYFLTYKTL